MSLEAISWAFAQPLPPTQKLVLLSLADHHNAKTGQCNPSIARIADRTGLGRRTIVRALAGLGDADLVQKEKRTGKRSNYILTGVTVAPHQCQIGTTPVPEWHHTSATAAHGTSKEQGKNPKGTGKAKPKVAMIEGWVAPDAELEWAREAYPHLDLDHETDKFIDYFMSKGEKRVAWNLSWRNWIRNADKFSRRSTPAHRKMDGISSDNRSKVDRALARRNGLRSDDGGTGSAQLRLVKG